MITGKLCIINSVTPNTVLARTIRAFSNSKPCGDFAIVTPGNQYWLRLHYGRIEDAAPVIRENGFLRAHFSYLLQAILKREGQYELYALAS